MTDEARPVAVITGGASGIGAGLAIALAQRGYRLALADVADAEPVADEVRRLGTDAIAAPCDVGEPASVAKLAALAYETFGKVNLLCANAGVVAFAPLLATPREDWERTIRVNFFGVLNTCQAFIPQMLQQSDDRHVLITASGAGLLASNVLPTGAYSASKFAAVGFGEQLRLELAPAGVGVTILCPGSVKTAILESASYSDGSLHLKPHDPKGPTPGREHVRRMDPRDVAELALEAAARNAPYVVTHPEMRPGLEARFAAQLEACDDTQRRLGLTLAK